MKGVEPSSSAWKAAALPLSYTRADIRFQSRPGMYWWRGLDSNQRRHSQRVYSPSPLTTRAPLHQLPISRVSVAGEPMDDLFGNHIENRPAVASRVCAGCMALTGAVSRAGQEKTPAAAPNALFERAASIRRSECRSRFGETRTGIRIAKAA